MRFFITLAFLISTVFPAFSQTRLKAFVADNTTHYALPFATVKVEGTQKSVITGINGQFTIVAPANASEITISYISYELKKVRINDLKENDTIFLSPAGATLGEVIVKPQKEKITRIINSAVNNKPLHNPDLYALYQCYVYYKMKVDIKPSEKALSDTAFLRRERERLTSKMRATDLPGKKDEVRSPINFNEQHLLLSETYSKRFYKRPEKLQEIVLASKFSGLKKTYFTSLVTDFLPFHAYSDYIQLNGKDFVSPVSRGWRQRYDFRLTDEIVQDNDTTFILSFTPKKNVLFNGLKGLVYINSDGYAISHFTATALDTSLHHEFRIDQVYDKSSGRWFPRELNYDVIFGEYITPLTKLQMNGHSVIDSISFSPGPDFKIEKAYSLRLSDSVDLRSAQEWTRMRPDPITVKEKNTYRVLDSLGEKMKIEKIITTTGKLIIGRLPYKFVDIDLARIIASNSYEGTRLGIGLFSNEKISRNFEIGAWFGYGFNDEKIKYGLSLTNFFKKNKDNWLKIFYGDDYQNAGNIRIHEEIDRGGYRTWLLSTPDRVKELGATLHFRKDYWEFEFDIRKQNIEAFYDNRFVFSGIHYNEFENREIGLGFRYAYGEKRAPAFGYYIGLGTKYPVIYFRSAFGHVNSFNYSTDYLRALMAIDFRKHINRWGNDLYRVEAGIIHSFNDNPLPRSFLLASKGFRRDGTNFYALGGFLTMRPYDYYSDKYVSFYYKHDIDKYFWKVKISQPFISLLHNSMFGSLNEENKTATSGISAPANGFHESGIILNQILRTKFFRSFYLNLNAGACYHWTSSFDWEKNGVWLMGLSVGL